MPTNYKIVNVTCHGSYQEKTRMIVSKSIRTLCIYLRLKYKAPNKRRNTLCSQGVDKMHHKDVKREEGKKRWREGERERDLY